MIPALKALCSWLENTRVSLLVQSIDWIIPAVQIVHILGLAVVLSGVALLNMRLLGAGMRRVPVQEMARHFLPFIWWALIVMACTGAILVIGEPRRELLNAVFRTKMVLVAAAALATAAFQSLLRRYPEAWGGSGEVRPAARMLAVVTLAVWTAIAVCGRLIAYAMVG